MDDAKVCDVITDNVVLHVVTRTDTIHDALKSLYKYHITSVPVIDLEYNCLGLLDILDILAFLVKVSVEALESRVTPLSRNLKDDDLDMLFERSAKLNCAAVEKVFNLSRRNPFLPCTYRAPLRDVMRVFAHGVHRVPVVKSEEPNIVINILTQSATNAFLAKDPELYLGDKANKTLQELGLIQGEDKIISVKDDTIAIDAFILMHEQGLSDVAVVNARGVFQGCLSASDLKLIKDYKFRSLLLPVMDFVRAVRQEEGRIFRNFLVHCGPEATLADVVRRLASESVHRVFVVNDGLKPIGVVSITDISRIVSGERPW